MSRARQALLVCFVLTACERSKPATPPVVSPQEQLARALAEARAGSDRLRATSPLPVTSQPLPPTVANVLLWVSDAGTVIDDAALVEGLPSPALLRRLAQRRGFGPRAVPDVIAELRALAAELPKVTAEEWASPPRSGAKWQSTLIGSLAAAPDLTVKQVLLAEGDVIGARLSNTRTVALRGDAGVVDVEVELRGPGFLEPELCAHRDEPRPACVTPELELSSRGWCARPARGLTGFPCLLQPRLSRPGALAALLGLDAGFVAPDFGLKFPRQAPRDADLPAPAEAAKEEVPCQPVSPEHLLTKVAELVATGPGCVRSRVTAFGEVRWGVLAPVLAELAASGLPAGVEWRPDPREADGGR